MAKKCYIPNVVNKVIESGNHWETQEYKQGIHRGEDLINRTNKTKASPDWIVAIEKGTVYATGYGTKMGYFVKLKHRYGYSVYMHLKKNSICVSKGQTVLKGQRVGFMGDTGQGVTGVHLHLAIMPTLTTYTDPYDYLVGIKSLDSKNGWVEGDYKVLVRKYVRTSAEVKPTNKIKYKNLIKSVQQLCVKDAAGYAKWEVGTILHLTEFKYDSKGNLWGKRPKDKNTDTWLCVKDKTGNQVEKI